MNWVTPLRGVQALFAVIVLGTSGYLVHDSDIHNYDFHTADYNVFTAVWTLVVCAFFIVTGFIGESFMTNAIIALVLDGLSWIFWLAAFAAMAAKLDSVENFYGYVGGTVGGCVKATIAFGVLEWLLFSATLVWNAMSGFRGKSSSGAPAHQGV